MMAVYQTHFGNPSSIHSQGRDARRLLDESRRTVAQYLNAKPNEVIFTSGATESNNTVIKGIAYANEAKGSISLRQRLNITLYCTFSNTSSNKDLK